MIILKCYCDRCEKEFETEYTKAFRLTNWFSLSNPSHVKCGDPVFSMTLCHECEEELLRWAGKENCMKKINENRDHIVLDTGEIR